MSHHINNVIILSLLSGAIASVITTAILLNNDTFVSSRVGSSVTNQTRTFDRSATSHEEAIIQTVERVNPAVVSIIVSQDVPINRPFGDIPTNDPFLEEFFERFRRQLPPEEQGGTQRQEIGGGSGFIISSDGMIVTNKHVVARENVEYTVLTNDGARYTAEVVARDPFNDVAILQIEASNLPYLEFADSDELVVGQTVIAIGNALAEFRNTVSTGVISGLSRSIIAGNRMGQSEQLEEVIQTDAAINPGNSGGPLLNLQGEVIGVNVAIALGSDNIGFALPANMVRSAVTSVIETGTIARPFLGIRYTNITPGIQTRNDLPVDYGVLVIGSQTGDEPAVIPDSPAAQAGIQAGDIILEADGVRLDEDRSLASIIRQKNIGEEIRLKILRNEEEIEVTATLEGMES